jgi:hypothetical protein
MLMAGVAGWDRELQTANIISTILTSTGKKVSAIDLRNLAELDIKRIKSYLYELDKNNTEVFLLKIDIGNVIFKILELLRFDIMMYTGRMDGEGSFVPTGGNDSLEKLFLMMEESNTVILNADDNEVFHFLKKMKGCVVTYGFNYRSDITASSIGDTLFENGFMCCLQKPIYSRSGIVIEPQEYRVDMELKDMDAYSVLAAAAFAVVAGVNLNMLNLAGAKI